MEKKPLTNYPTPEYPKLGDVPDLNTLINSSLPRHWTQNSIKYSALAILLASFSNSQELTLESHFYGRGNKYITHRIISDKIPAKIKNQYSQVAPVFYHGEGTGAYGCVVMSPPVFLSEDEAMKVIKAEFSKAGITLDLPNVVIPLPSKIQFDKATVDSLMIDAYSTKYNLLVSYVGNTENSLVFGPNYSTVSHIRTKAAADSLAHTLAKTKGYKIAQFYAPLLKNDFSHTAEARKKNYEDNKESLAMQVRDFLAWAAKHDFLTPLNTRPTNTPSPTESKN